MEEVLAPGVQDWEVRLLGNFIGPFKSLMSRCCGCLFCQQDPEKFRRMEGVKIIVGQLIQISGDKSALWWEQKIQMSGGTCDNFGGGK